MNILMLTSEAFPFAKAGGLGDVVPQLSESLASLGNRVVILLPLYESIDRSTLVRVDSHVRVEIAGSSFSCSLFHCTLAQGTEVYFLAHEYLYSQSGIYVDENGKDYPNNLLRFAVLSNAAQAFAESIHIQFDIIHAHDWPTALSMLSTKKSAAMRVFNIHNIGYQGIFPAEQIGEIGFTQEEFHSRGFEYHGRLSLLQSGIANADKILTVSEQYAQEILTDDLGFGMQNILRARKECLFGILNGVDYSVWNPESDSFIPYRYSAQSLSAKTKNKEYLQETLKLETSDTPVIGIVSRLVGQKGLSILLEQNARVITELCNTLEAQLVILGQGEKHIEESLKDLENSCPNLRVLLAYNEATSHVIQAASDFFLIPSLYEPCGLTQMYALKYGSVPIVSHTGGLIDTVTDISTPNGLGIIIGRAESHYALNVDSILEALQRARALWKNSEAFAATQIRGMKQNFTWEKAAHKYMKIYTSA